MKAKQINDYSVANWENVSCPICNGTNADFYERFGHDWEFTYLLCKTCKVVYQNPRPLYDMAFIENAYENYAVGRWHWETDGYLEKQGIQFDRLIDEVLTLNNKPQAILDVGCGVGLFLNSARKKYPRYSGIEISNSNAVVSSKLLNIEIYRGSFESYPEAEKFSCINISHVIEHIPNPNEWLQKARILLDKDGLLIIEVPNWMGWAQKIKWVLKRAGLRKGKWPKNKMPEHLYEPTLSGMNFLFEKNGFQTIKYYTYSRSDLTAKKFTSRIFHRLFKGGSNFRFYLKVA